MYHVDMTLLDSKLAANQDFTGKRVLLRTCLNVITDAEGNMTDDTRYQESFPFIQTLSSQAKTVLITAHLGRPKAQEPQFSFASVVKKLATDLGKTVHFVTNIDDVATLGEWIYFLENIRFFPGEDSKDPAEKETFAKLLTHHMDCFVNDAFADYRESVSTYEVAKYLPSYIGPVFAREVIELNSLNSAQRPFVAILWGSKLSEKLDALLSLLQLADKVLVGWAMRYTIFKAMGYQVGNALVEEDKLDIAKEIIAKYKDKMVLPEDHMIVTEFKDPAEIGYTYTESTDIPDGHTAIDIWPKGIQQFVQEIAQAKTIAWNGPVGVFEWETSAHGTREVGKSIAANTSAYKLIWGGDSIAAVNSLGLTGFNHISTWWGAMLSFLAYDTFPVLDVILQW